MLLSGANSPDIYCFHRTRGCCIDILRAVVGHLFVGSIIDHYPGAKQCQVNTHRPDEPRIVPILI
ncbi:hypothetical protein MMARE11_p00340 (plasmid) [Mycobacterium marinum E11]|nr:hypothetical protein MMARE11_p00340 [Mycobacterium marinum E11]